MRNILENLMHQASAIDSSIALACFRQALPVNLVTVASFKIKFNADKFWTWAKSELPVIMVTLPYSDFITLQDANILHDETIVKLNASPLQAMQTCQALIAKAYKIRGEKFHLKNVHPANERWQSRFTKKTSGKGDDAILSLIYLSDEELSKLASDKCAIRLFRRSESLRLSQYRNMQCPKNNGHYMPLDSSISKPKSLIKQGENDKGYAATPSKPQVSIYSGLSIDDKTLAVNSINALPRIASASKLDKLARAKDQTDLTHAFDLMFQAFTLETMDCQAYEELNAWE